MSKLQIVSPKGELQWATINGQGKADLQGRMMYTIDVVCTPEDAAPVIEQLEALWDENKPKGAKAPKSMGYKETDDGQIRFTFKTGTTYQSGDTKEIKVYNAKAKQVHLEDKIGNGSIGRVSGLAAVYDAGVAARGVTLYLDAVQVINLIKYVGAASNFGEEEGDFEGTDSTDGFTAEDLV